VRIFHDLDAGMLAGHAPSCFVYGGIAGACVGRSSSCGSEDEGPDRVLLLLSRVMFAYFENFDIVLYFLRALLVICSPQLPGISGSYPFKKQAISFVCSHIIYLRPST
jgi:hypothetical protein